MFLSSATERRGNKAGIIQEVVFLEGRQNRLIVHDIIQEQDMAGRRQWVVGGPQQTSMQCFMPTAG